MDQSSTSTYYDSMDNGNLFNKSINDNEEAVVRNVVIDYEGTDAEFRDIEVAAQRKETTDAIATDSVLFWFENKQRLIGELCYQIDPSVQSNTGNERWGSEEWNAMIAGVLARLHPRRSGTIGLTYSLPVSQFRTTVWRPTDDKGNGYEQKVVEYVRELLTRTWEVEINGKLNRYDVVGELLDLLPEGYGTIADLCISDNGRQITDQTLAEGRVIVIDVGGGTTDILTFDRLRPGSYNESLSTGLIHVRKRVEKAIRSKYNRDNIPAKILDEIIQTKHYTHAGYKPDDVSKIVEAAVEDLMEDIKEEWTQSLGRGVDYNAVVISGGGGPVIAPLLKERIKHGGIYEVPAGKAHMANASGGHKRRKMQREVARALAAQAAAGKLGR